MQERQKGERRTQHEEVVTGRTPRSRYSRSLLPRPWSVLRHEDDITQMAQPRRDEEFSFQVHA